MIVSNDSSIFQNFPWFPTASGKLQCDNIHLKICVPFPQMGLECLICNAYISYNTKRQHVTRFGHTVNDISRSITHADVCNTCSNRLSERQAFIFSILLRADLSETGNVILRVLYNHCLWIKSSQEQTASGDANSRQLSQHNVSLWTFTIAVH